MAAGDVVLGTAWPLVGALVVRAQPRNPVGWLMLVPSLIGVYLLAGVYAESSGGEGPLGVLAAWFAIWGFAPYFFTLPVLPHVFPDGRPLSPRWGRVVAVTVGVGVVTTVARMFAPVPADLAPDVMNPFGVEGATWLRYVTMAGAASLFFVGVPLAVLSLVLRMRRAREPERTQLYWLVLGGLALVVAALLPFGGAGETWGLAVGLLAFPAAIGVGMLRHGLFDVELTLNRTVVLGLITGFVVGVYVLVVYVAQAVAPGSHWGVLLVALAALAAAAGGSGCSAPSTGCSTASGATRSPSPPRRGRRWTPPPPRPRRCRRSPTRWPARCGCRRSRSSPPIRGCRRCARRATPAGR